MDVKQCAYVMGCSKPVLNHKQKYCSREHAPYGNYDGNLMYEKRTQKSTSKARGVRSRRASIYDPKEESKVPIQRFGQRRMQGNLHGSIETPKEHVKVNENNGTLLHLNKNTCEELNPTPKSIVIPLQDGQDKEKTMQKTESSISKTNLDAEEVESQVMASNQQLKVLENEKSASMSLIDESAKHLRDLMKSVEKNQAGILSACHCASQIHKLIRLKFDIVRSYNAKQ